jgi:hypothetical protein
MLITTTIFELNGAPQMSSKVVPYLRNHLWAHLRSSKLEDFFHINCIMSCDNVVLIHHYFNACIDLFTLVEAP